jgi:microcystin-dependent protein
MDPFVGQLLLAGFNFAPKGWALCQGQIMPLSQNTALFSLLGTIYGGDGKSTFGLPDMRARVGMGQGNGVGLTSRVMGELGGSPSVTLLLSELPKHQHAANAASVNGNQATPINFATGESPNIYAGGAPNAGMSASAIGLNGGNQPHNNMMPYQTLNWCIALQGVYPQRS